VASTERRRCPLADLDDPVAALRRAQYLRVTGDVSLLHTEFPSQRAHAGSDQHEMFFTPRWRLNMRRYLSTAGAPSRVYDLWAHGLPLMGTGTGTMG